MSLNHESSSKTPFIYQVWRFISSPRLALTLILILIILCLFGALLIQAPSQIMANPESYALWVESMVKPRLGVWADIFSFLRLFDVFHSPWFLAAGSLLMINILACTINRWRSIMAFGGRVKQPVTFFRTGTHKAESIIAQLPDKAGTLISDVLKKRHYRVRAENSDGVVNIAADKNRFSPWGTFLTHLSIILFVLGFMVSSLWGFRNESFVVAEGSKKEVGNGTGLALELKSFEDEYWPNGSPRDFRSEVVLYSEGQEVAQALVRVNSPLSYHGINFYQSSFGPAARIRVQAAGEDLYDESVPLSQSFDSMGLRRYNGVLDLPQEGMTVRLISSALNGPDPIIGKNELAVLISRPGMDEPVIDLLEAGVPRELEGLQFTFVGQEQYSVFQVTYSPGTALIWIASGLFIIGLGIVFYFPYRQLWVLVEPEKENKSSLTVRATGRSSPGRDEINTIMKQVENNIS